MLKPIAACLLAVVFILGTSQSFFAAERMEWKDEDGDGRKESQVFYDGVKITKIQIDKNGDGKTDQWIHFKNGKKYTAEIDSDFDGKIDKWIAYDSEGKIMTIAKDSNHDGRPDQYQAMLKGREIMLKEYDRNFDGRMDKRVLMQWNPNKKISAFMNGRLSSIPNPGYTWLWREEDNDYDGKIDVYQERGNKNPSKDKIGKEIAPLPTKPEEKKSESPSEKKRSQTESLIETMNKRYGSG